MPKHAYNYLAASAPYGGDPKRDFMSPHTSKAQKFKAAKEMAKRMADEKARRDAEKLRKGK